MATYPILPPTLAALFATKDDPQGSEPISVVDDALRQTRNWLYDFLSLYIDNSTGKFKPSAFVADGGSLPPGSVRGTNPVGNIQREIAQGSVQGADLADGTVTGGKIAQGTITGANVANASLNGSKLEDGSVTSTKISAGVFATANIQDGAITGPKIAVNTIPGDRLVDKTVENSKIGLRAVAGPELPIALEGQMLVGGNGPEGKDVAAKTVGGAIEIDKDGVVKLAASIFGNAITYARVLERAAAGVHGGNAAGGVWRRRGSGADGIAPWTIDNATRDFLELGANGQIYFKESGKYLVNASAPARGAVDQHKVVLGYVPNPGDTSTARAYIGTSEDCDTNVQTYSKVEALIDVTLPNDEVASRPYMFLAHHPKTNQATDGYGLASNILTAPTPFSTLPIHEVYADISILKVQETTD